MNIPYILANLKKRFIILDGFLIFSKIILEYTHTIIGSALVSNFTGPFASKSQNGVVFLPSQWP